MGYAVVAIVVGAVVGLATGGSFKHLGDYRLAGWYLLPAGIVLQVLSASSGGNTALALMVASYACLIAVAAINIRVVPVGMALVATGLALNLVVIAANRGMPVRPSAVVDAGIVDSLTDLRDIRLRAKHHYEKPDSRLMFLADVIPVRPLREVLSLGDLVMSAGVAFCVSSLLRKQPTHPQAERSHSLPSER